MSPSNRSGYQIVVNCELELSVIHSVRDCSRLYLNEFNKQMIGAYINCIKDNWHKDETINSVLCWIYNVLLNTYIRIVYSQSSKPSKMFSPF